MGYLETSGIHSYAVKKYWFVSRESNATNTPLGWFINIGSDFGAYLPQNRFLSHQFRCQTNHPKGAFGGGRNEPIFFTV